MRLEPFRLLLVDDEVELIDKLLKRMKMRRVDVEGVNSGPDALALLDRKKFDVVVLDVKMPKMDGIETLREIKKRYPIIEVIMLTGHANVEVAIQGMELGAFDYLLKPIKIDQLLYKIQDAYKKKSLTDQKIVQKRETFGRAE
ncbi:MAG: response regulator [bacterium]|nr:response regulator [bacterium]